VSDIHPTAIIEDSVELADDVVIGPYCHIYGKVKLSKGINLVSHVIIAGNTTIGENTKIYPFASVGLPPQDLKYAGEESELVIGSDNIIREYVTINPGTSGGGMVTRIGNNCLFMIGSHVAHDCIIGNNVIMANNATLAGHVEIGDHVVLGGLSAVHQFVRIGAHAMIGGMSGIENDIIPYGSAMGERANLSGLNIVGLKRRDFSRDEVHTLRSAYRLLFSPEGTLSERIADVKERFKDNQLVMEIVNFILTDSSRPICQPKNGNKAAA